MCRELLGNGSAVGVLGISEGLVVVREHGLDVSQDRIDPLELRQITRLALAHDFDRVSAPGIGDRGEARQAVAEYVGADSQAGAGPRGYRLAGEAWHRRELDKARAALVIERDCCNEGHLVFGAATGLATGEFAAKVGIVDLHRPRQSVLGLARRHGRHDLVVHQPGRGVTHTDVALE